MNLIKNVDGNPDIWKGKVRQDLDTIQRNFNALQASHDALKLEVETIEAPAPAVINAQNLVTAVPSTDFLTTVAVGAGLSGDGTPAHPLIASGGGTTNVLSLSRTLTSLECQTLFSVPIPLLPATAGVGWAPLILFAYSHQLTTMFYTTAAGLFYAPTTWTGATPNLTPATGLISPFQTSPAGDTWATKVAANVNWPSTISGLPLYIESNIDQLPGFDPGNLNSVKITLAYLALTF